MIVEPVNMEPGTGRYGDKMHLQDNESWFHPAGGDGICHTIPFESSTSGEDERLTSTSSSSSDSGSFTSHEHKSSVPDSVLPITGIKSEGTVTSSPSESDMNKEQTVGENTIRAELVSDVVEVPATEVDNEDAFGRSNLIDELGFGFLTCPQDDSEGESVHGDNDSLSDSSELDAHLDHVYDTESETGSFANERSESSLMKRTKADAILYSSLRGQKKKRGAKAPHVPNAPLKAGKSPNIMQNAGKQACMDNLKRRWHERSPDKPLSDECILRFAYSAPGGPFHESSAWRRMKRFHRRYLSLTAKGLERQLLTKTLFPVPGVETKEGNNCFYMRPSRYFPKHTTVMEIIDNLCYVMNTMNENEYNAANGIGFIANMDSWKFDNFEVKYCFCFMMALQGRAVPTRVTHFLIVNPPSWFGKIWSIMKTMLAPSFQKKVKMIPESELSTYLKPGFEKYLPDDTSSGHASSTRIVLDFVRQRKTVERSRLER